MKKCLKSGDEPEKIEKFTGLWHENEKCDDGKTQWKTHQEPRAHQILQRYMDDTGISEMGTASTPGRLIDKSELLDDEPGELAERCRRHAGALMFLARGSRPDILYTVGWLARYVTNWTRAQDKVLRQLVRHINGTAKYGLIGTIGDSCVEQNENLWVELYTDADLARCHETSRPASGGVLVLKGDQGTFLPIDWSPKRQTVAPRSTGGAELVAMNDALVKIGIGNHAILESIYVCTDSSAAKSSMEDGYGGIKYTKRTHMISIGWLKDLAGIGLIQLKKIEGGSSISDVMTKFLGRQMQKEAAGSLGMQL